MLCCDVIDLLFGSVGQACEYAGIGVLDLIDLMFVILN